MHNYGYGNRRISNQYAQLSSIDASLNTIYYTPGSFFLEGSAVEVGVLNVTTFQHAAELPPHVDSSLLVNHRIRKEYISGRLTLRVFYSGADPGVASGLVNFVVYENTALLNIPLQSTSSNPCTLSLTDVSYPTAYVFGSFQYELTTRVTPIVSLLGVKVERKATALEDTYTGSLYIHGIEIVYTESVNNV